MSRFFLDIKINFWGFDINVNGLPGTMLALQGEKARWSQLSVIIHQHSSACLRLNSGNFHTTQSGGVTGVGVLNNYW